MQHVVKAGDEPTLAFQLLDGDGAPIDLTGQPQTARLGTPGSAAEWEVAATITDAANGLVSIALTAEMTAAAPRNIFVEFRPTTGAVLTTPNDGYGVIRVDKTIGPFA